MFLFLSLLISHQESRPLNHVLYALFIIVIYPCIVHIVCHYIHLASCSKTKKKMSFVHVASGNFKVIMSLHK